MKRQRNADNYEGKKAAKAAASGSSSMGRKKGKKAMEMVEEETRVAEVNSGKQSTVAGESSLLGWDDDLPWFGGVVDEQMSWGSIWLPIWDVEYYMKGEEAYHGLFSDVAWDDDIWNLKSINSVPDPRR